MFVPNFKILDEVVPEKSVTKNFEKKKNGQIKGMLSMRMQNLSYTIQVVIPNVCTKSFQTPSGEVPEKSLTHISLCITLE